MESRLPYNHDIGQHCINILDVLRPEQLDQLARCLREVIEGKHGDVVITVKDGKPRFISTRISEDFADSE